MNKWFAELMVKIINKDNRVRACALGLIAVLILTGINYPVLADPTEGAIPVEPVEDIAVAVSETLPEESGSATETQLLLNGTDASGTTELTEPENANDMKSVITGSETESISMCDVDTEKVESAPEEFSDEILESDRFNKSEELLVEKELTDGNEKETEEEEEVAFEANLTIEGVKITITADEGVFTAGSYAEAKKIFGSEEEKVEEAIEEVRVKEKNVAASYTFDIAVYDKEGEKIEPDTEKGFVNITFKMAEIANDNLETDVYHIEKTDDGLNVENLTAKIVEGNGEEESGESEADDEVTVETDGFSYYTVEFTYGELQYVLKGGEKVALKEVMETVGLVGEPKNVIFSSKELVEVEQTEESWILTSLQPFNTEEELTITIAGESEDIDYVIRVTDDMSGRGMHPHCGSHDGATFETAINSLTGLRDMFANGGSGYLTTDIELTANDDDLIIQSGKTVSLCLNGYVVKRTGYKKDTEFTATNTGGVIQVLGTLKLYDCDTATPHYFREDTSSILSGDTVQTAYPFSHPEFCSCWRLTDTPTETEKSNVVYGGCITGGWPCGNGNIIQGGLNVKGISSGARATLEMYGGNIVGNSTSRVYNGGASGYTGNGAGIFIDQYSTFKMYGGMICHNFSNNMGGGIAARSSKANSNDTNIYIYGGRIEYNIAKGVSVGDYANGGGGVCVFRKATMSILGGTISHNYTYGNGGGILNNSNAAPIIGGTADVKDNYAIDRNDITKKTLNNLYLGSGKTITLATGEDAPQSGMNVGVNTATNPMSGSPVNIAGNADSSYTKFFYSDNPQYYVAFISGDSYLKLSVPEANKYAINVITPVNGEAASDASQQTAGETVTITVTPNTGYLLKANGLKASYSDGTDKNCDLTKVNDSTYTFTMPENPITVTAMFEPITSTVTLDMQGGSNGTESVSATYDSDMPSAIMPTRTGCIFLGYYDSQSGGTLYYDASGNGVRKWNYSVAKTLYAHWHEHSWGIINDTNALYAFCENGTDCPYHCTTSELSKAIKISVNKPTSTAYTGDANDASVVGDTDTWSTTVGTVPSIAYEYRATSTTTYSSASDTTKAGWYRASITSGGVTASVEYEIAKADRNVSVSVESWTYGQTGAVPQPTLSAALPLPGEPTITYYYNTENSITGGTAWSEITDTASLNAKDVYYVYAVISETENYSAFTTAANSFSVAKADCVVTPPTGKIGLVYSGETQDLLDTRGSVDGGTIKYCDTQNGTYTDAMPMGKDAKTYEVWYTGVGDDNHNNSTPDKIEVVIGRAQCTLTAPTKEQLTYNGSPQALVSGGNVIGGELQYSTSEDGTYSTSVPTGEDAGPYEVWYKVVADSNYIDIPATKIDITIDKAKWVITKPKAIPSLVYTGSEQELITEGSVNDSGELQYSLDDEAHYSTDIPKGIENREYKVYFYVEGDNNHYDSTYEAQEDNYITVSMGKAARGDSTPSMDSYTYDQKEALPTPSISPNPSDKEAYQTVTFYYNTVEGNSGGTEWKDITAITLDEGTYYIYAKVEATTHYQEYTTAPSMFTVNKGESKVASVPKAIAPIYYTGEAQPLIEAGIAIGGDLLYSLDGTSYSSDIPTAKDNGEYTIYYKVIGDKNHNDTAAESLKVSITRKERSGITASVESYKYRQKEDIPTPALLVMPTDNPEITFYYNTQQKNSGGIEWKDMTTSSLEIGTYYIYATVGRTDFYKEYTTDATAFTVDKRDPKPITEKDIWVDVKDDVVTETIIDSDGVELIETVRDESGAVVKQGDYEKTVRKTDNENSIDYTVTYTFTGEYSGTVKKIVSVQKQKEEPGDNPDDNIRTIVDMDEEVKQYNPDIPAVAKSKVKTIVAKDISENKDAIEEQLRKYEVETKPTVEELVEKLETSSKDIALDSKLIIEVESEDEGSVPKEDVTKVLDEVKKQGADENNIKYLDVSMFVSYLLLDKDSKKIVEMSRQRITDTQDFGDVTKDFETPITINVPADMRNVDSNVERTFYVARVHVGVTDILAKTTGVTITFKTGKFSTYALFYKDREIPKDDPSGSGSSSGSTGNTQNMTVTPVMGPGVVMLSGYESPKTGDSKDVVILAALLLIGIGVTIGGARKRKHS